jgi:hypothetical protein
MYNGHMMLMPPDGFNILKLIKVIHQFDRLKRSNNNNNKNIYISSDEEKILEKIQYQTMIETISKLLMKKNC